MTNARVSRVRGIALGAPKALESEAFYTDGWGLETVHKDSRAVYLRASGPEHHVLALCDRPERGIVYIDLAVQDEASLRALHDGLADSDVKIAAPIEPLDTPAC